MSSSSNVKLDILKSNIDCIKQKMTDQIKQMGQNPINPICLKIKALSNFK